MATMPQLDDYGVELAANDRRRKLAETLGMGSLEPIQQQNVGGQVVPTHPLQALAKVFQGYIGGKGVAQADARQKELAQALLGRRSQTVQQAMAAMQGTPGRFTGEAGTGDELFHQPTPGNPQAAYGILAGSGDPSLSAAGTAAMLKSMEPFNLREGEIRQGPGGVIASNPKAPQPFSLSPGQTRYGADGQQIVSAPEAPYTMSPGQVRMGTGNQPIATAPKDPWSEPYQMGGAWVQKNESTGEVRQAVGREPQLRVISPPAVTTARVVDPSDPSRMIEVDARTYRGGSLGAPGVIGVSGRESDPQKREGKRQFNMQGLGQTISEAEGLLSGSSGRALPTESVIGTGLDLAGQVVGASPRGAAEADRLRAIGGALTAKMPRMEGPQSDRDVQLYREMAASVGDSKLPRERRLAALNQVKELWAKYERLNPEAFEGGTPPAPDPAPTPTPQRRSTDKVRRYNPATGRIE